MGHLHYLYVTMSTMTPVNQIKKFLIAENDTGSGKSSTDFSKVLKTQHIFI